MTKISKTTAAFGGFALLAALVFIFTRSRDTKTTVRLEDRDGECVLTKEAYVTVRKDKHVIWVIDNQCRNKDVLVTVGNFRRPGGTSASTCLAPTAGTGVVWPFQEDIHDLSKRQHKNRIQLKIKKDADLPGDRLEYDYDICTGAGADQKWDPRLVIER